MYRIKDGWIIINLFLSILINNSINDNNSEVDKRYRIEYMRCIFEQKLPFWIFRKSLGKRLFFTWKTYNMHLNCISDIANNNGAFMLAGAVAVFNS